MFKKGPKVSFVIPTRNRPDELTVCLESLCKEDVGKRSSIHIIDDASNYRQKVLNQIICNKFKVDYCYLEKNRGMAVARNIGISRSNGDWVAFLDDDVVVDSGWYTTLRNNLQSVHENVVGIEGKVTASGGGLWDNEVQNSSQGGYLTCHIIYKKCKLEQVGGFDSAFEYLGPFCEDHELALRMLEQGFISYCPDLKVTHQARSINYFDKITSTTKRMRGLIKAECYFYLKHPMKYKSVRYHSSFFQTYRAILMKHTLTSMRRRGVRKLCSKPLEALMLVLMSSWEQINAWFLLPAVINGRILDVRSCDEKTDWCK
ncbi:glycosyltransferase [Chitinispirillales bacterium ANBcel5]|uniref:glycosyltransferase family 2 protein n=1 Tax=Cellulosispirillum alkaliphilum TaxID=3039283 RepID=UPI002A58AC6F|nr:glycosyltransferase [Chitinispirillales bacterium ANBcel5]